MGGRPKHTPVTVAKAKHQYVVMCKSIDMISEDIGASRATIHRWVIKGRWDEKRAQHLAETAAIARTSRKDAVNGILTASLDLIKHSLDSRLEEAKNGKRIPISEAKLISGIVSDFDRIMRLEAGEATDIVKTYETVTLEAVKQALDADPFIEVEHKVELVDADAPEEDGYEYEEVDVEVEVDENGNEIEGTAKVIE